MNRCYGTYQSRMNQLMHPCRRAAYTERDGKWYCPACDPQGAQLKRQYPGQTVTARHEMTRFDHNVPGIEPSDGIDWWAWVNKIPINSSTGEFGNTPEEALSKLARSVDAIRQEQAEYAKNHDPAGKVADDPAGKGGK